MDPFHNTDDALIVIEGFHICIFIFLMYVHF